LAKEDQKKPKTEDEENADNEELRNRAANALKNELIHNRISKAEKEVEIVRYNGLLRTI